MWPDRPIEPYPRGGQRRPIGHLERLEEVLMKTLRIRRNRLARRAALFSWLAIVTALATSPAAQAGSLYVSLAVSGEIVQFTSGGAESVFATGLKAPAGLAFDSHGNLYEADSNYPFENGSINEFAPGGSMTTFASGLGDTIGLAFDGSGDLFVGDDSAEEIYKITPGGVLSVFASNVYPSGLAFDSAGDLFVADTGYEVGSHVGRIYEFTPGGVQSTFASGMGYLNGEAFDSAGNLYVVDSTYRDIYAFTPGGVRSTFASGLPNPDFLAFDPSGNLYVSDQSGYIFEFTPGGVRSTFASGLSGDPQGLAFNSGVPEPASVSLLVAGLAGILVLRKRIR